MFTLFQALLDAWPYVLLVGYAVVNLLNALTPHYTQRSGATSWLTALLERLSVMTSRQADMPFKLPLASAPPNRHIKLWRRPPTAISAILALLIMVGGCASTSVKGHVTNIAGYATYGARQISAVTEPLFRDRCTAVAIECRDAGLTVCPGWEECAAQRDKVNKAIKSIHIASIAAVQLAEAGDASSAWGKIEGAF